jgi:hypothetical protein
MWFRLSAAAVLGAVIPHLIVFILAFLRGVVFGAGDIMSSGPGHYVHGIEGGEKAVATVGAVYLLSVGIIPIFVSIVGAVIASMVALSMAKSAGPAERPVDR